MTSATPSPTSAPDPVPVVLASSCFISHEHATTGTATTVENPDGTRMLAFEDLDTTNGPDVHVWLSAIKWKQGDQVYDVPADVDLSLYRSAVRSVRRLVRGRPVCLAQAVRTRDRSSRGAR